jgi:uncharacterized protein (DUF885 family)
MPPSTPHDRAARSLKRLARDYYDETFERFPVQGSQAGIVRLRTELGRARASDFERQLRLARRTLRALESMPVHDFAGDAGLDRRTLRSHLRREIMDLGELATWRRNPQIGLDNVGEAIFGLLVRHADNLAPVADALMSRLKAIPRYLDEAAENIEAPVPLWAELTKATAPGIVALIDSIPPALAAVRPEASQRVERLAAAARKAVRTYDARVARKRPGPAPGFAVGPERFQQLIYDRLGLDLTPREIVAAARTLASRLEAELKAEARRFHPRKSASEIIEEAREAWKPEGRDLLSTYKRHTREIRSAFRETGVVTFPRAERLDIKLVPDFLLHLIPTAAYSAPGPLEKDQRGIFWVNDLSLHKSRSEDKAREIAQHFGIELTCAHEAYPGHHLQFIRQNRHPSFVRRMASHSIYYEGWTLWCEQMSVDLQVSDNPLLRLIQLHDALWRAWRIVIDCGLQTGELSYDRACRLLQRELGFSRDRARTEINWYSAAPTVPMSYLLGKMELLRLKRRHVEEGGWTLRRFNDWVLGFGAIPWSWIETSGL